MIRTAFVGKYQLKVSVGNGPAVAAILTLFNSEQVTGVTPAQEGLVKITGLDVYATWHPVTVLRTFIV